ncbi:MAG TPA: hypothetical protein VGL18_14185 [Actinomycetota bacterium]
MSSKIEALPLPRQKGSSSRMWWIAALLAAFLAAASLGSYLALRNTGSGASPQVRHSVVAPPAAPALQPAEQPAGPQVKEIRDVGGVAGISGPAIGFSRTGPRVVENAGSDSHKARPKFPDCRQARPGPC